jgi:hypothetical protein
MKFMNELGGHKKKLQITQESNKTSMSVLLQNRDVQEQKCFSMCSFLNLFNDTFPTVQIYTETVG